MSTRTVAIRMFSPPLTSCTQQEFSFLHSVCTNMGASEPPESWWEPKVDVGVYKKASDLSEEG